MTVLMMILGLGLLAMAVWCAVRAGVLPRLAMRSHLAQIDGYGTEEASELDDPGAVAAPVARPAVRLAGSVGRFAARSIPSVPRLERKALYAAGIYSMEPEVMEGLRLMAGAALALLVLLYTVALSHGISILGLVFVLAAAFMGWDLPALVIRRRGRARLLEIDKQLPDLIDLLVASVEAGLAVGASIALLADRFTGPLGQELQLVLQQQRLGTSTPTAMAALSDRADTPGVRAFARTLVRAEAMGGSIGPVLRNLAADARRRRRQQASERAAKVPLILFIFPALFVVLLYPAGYTIVSTFGH
jgi:tight adherence protein C